MKSTELFNKIICPVNCKYGSPMGRRSNYSMDKIPEGKLFDRRVKLNSGAYDKGGAYWGFPNNLRVKYNKDLSCIFFYRTY